MKPEVASGWKMEEQEMQLKVKKVTDKFTESMYFLANEPSLALYRLQEHVRRSLPELVQHKVRGGQTCKEWRSSAKVPYIPSNTPAVPLLHRQFLNLPPSLLPECRAKRAPLPFQCWMVYSVNNGRKAHSGSCEEKGSDGIRF
ncbi:BLOC-1-related complex subunit 8 isoform X4 [Mustelus asterias]